MPQRSRLDAEPAALSHIGESAVAVVAVEDVLSPVSDEQIVEAVVVVIAHANAASPAGLEQSGALGDIGEGAVAIVFVEAIAGAARGIAKRLPERRKISSQPSLSKSKKAQPQPRVSTMYSLRSLSP